MHACNAALHGRPGEAAVKVVLFCGGQGTRLRDYSDQIPKPLVPVGDRPILWHIMKYYAAFGHKDFVLALGYKGEAIKRFFLDYDECVTNDFVFENGGARLELLKRDIEDWRITFVDTGQSTNIGGRLLKVRKHLEGEPMFLANYADTLTDLDLDAMVAGFSASDALAGFACVRPPYSFHLVSFDERAKVTAISDVARSDMWMNGGYFVLRPGDLRQPRRRRGAGHRGLRAADAPGPALRPPARDASGPAWTPSRRSRRSTSGWRRATPPGRSGRGRRMRGVSFGALGTVLLIGAHSDDIEIGAGATVLRLVREHPGLRVVWVVLSARGVRAAEARACAAAFLEGAGTAEVLLQEFRDGHFPAAWAEIKAFFETLKPVAPDLILTHHGGGPAPGPPHRGRADLEHLPRPRDPGIRDPEVGRRPGRRRTSSCPRPRRTPRRRSRCSWTASPRSGRSTGSTI